MKYLPDIGYPQTGEKVSSGTYCCMRCNSNGQDMPECIVLTKEKTLPSCKNCGATWWMKI